MGCSAQTDQINPESLDKKLDELIDVLHLNDQLPLLKEQMFNQKKQIDLYFNNSADSAVTQVLEDAIDKIITPEYINQNIREVYKITFTYEEISGMVIGPGGNPLYL